MLEGIKRWLAGGSTPPAREWDGVVPWAESQQYVFRGVADEGFVVDGRLGATAWRLEWGPSQRPYIAGHELRIRSELGLASDLQVVVMNRTLQVEMEKTVYEQYVEGVQTRIDNQTPPEMRWLVMYPKLAASEIGPLKERYVALGSQKEWLQQWLQGPLASGLQTLRVEPDTPMVLMIGRGRLMLRTALDDAAVPRLQAWLRLFESALREAQRVAHEGHEPASTGTNSSLWMQSALPGDERKR
jgi:hypothetical protein